MEDLIERIKQIDQLQLPNGAKGAIWVDDVIEVIEKYFCGDLYSYIGENNKL